MFENKFAFISTCDRQFGYTTKLSGGEKKNTGLQLFFSFLEVFYLWFHQKYNYKFGPQGKK
jgi:hypothetical protein